MKDRTTGNMFPASGTEENQTDHCQCDYQIIRINNIPLLESYYCGNCGKDMEITDKPNEKKIKI